MAAGSNSFSPIAALRGRGLLAASKARKSVKAKALKGPALLLRG